MKQKTKKLFKLVALYGCITIPMSQGMKSREAPIHPNPNMDFNKRLDLKKVWL